MRSTVAQRRSFAIVPEFFVRQHLVLAQPCPQAGKNLLRRSIGKRADQLHQPLTGDCVVVIA